MSSENKSLESAARYSALEICNTIGEREIPITSTDELDGSFYSEDLPTIAYYYGRTIEGVELASYIGALDQTDHNSVYLHTGAGNEVIDDSGFYVRSGFMFNRNSSGVVVFNTETPIPVDLVDHGHVPRGSNGTYDTIQRLGISTLRSAEATKLDHKKRFKSSAESVGFRTAKDVVIEVPKEQPIEQSQIVSALEEVSDLSSGDYIVIKPTSQLMGLGVVFIEKLNYAEKETIQTIANIALAYGNMIVEEYIDLEPIIIDGTETYEQWNVRSLAFDGFNGAAIRYRDEDMALPVNEYQGAKLAHIGKSVLVNSGYDIEDMVTDYTEEFSRATQPNSPLGLDVGVDRNGVPVMFEVNAGDFGGILMFTEADQDYGLQWVRRYNDVVSKLLSSYKSNRDLTSPILEHTPYDPAGELNAAAYHIAGLINEDSRASDRKAKRIIRQLSRSRLIPDNISAMLNGDNMYALPSLRMANICAKILGNGRFTALLEREAERLPQLSKEQLLKK